MWASSALLLACAGGVEDDTAPIDTTATDPSQPPPVERALGDANNYTLSGTLDVPSTPVRAGDPALTFDWSALTEDLQCHPVDPVADIDNVAFLAFPNKTEAEIEAGLQASDLEQVDLGGYVSLQPGDRTSVRLEEMTFFGTDVDIELLFTQGSGTWLALLTTGTSVGVGTRALGFVEPRDDVDALTVDLSPNCGILDLDADLSSLTPVAVRASGEATLDWSGLTVDGQGNPIELGNVDRVMLGHYPDHTPEALAAAFLDLEILTTEVWDASTDGAHVVDLRTLTRDGVGFPGFEGGGTWLFALRCSLCSNPAPVFATVLEPR